MRVGAHVVSINISQGRTPTTACGQPDFNPALLPRIIIKKSVISRADMILLSY
ncbi:Hypothetical protein GbCGDNIH2_5040 [Granulibacter bethesdensis]|nr:Hypothetical protein GbCGDNIH4_5040 [Granulibacter bethesdensis CGDNIH4]AHJ67881.1 Hypothetical protein GbCGDNIH2_5040 [Granulibacter bethesdensis]